MKDTFIVLNGAVELPRDFKNLKSLQVEGGFIPKQKFWLQANRLIFTSELEGRLVTVEYEPFNIYDIQTLAFRAPYPLPVKTHSEYYGHIKICYN